MRETCCGAQRRLRSASERSHVPASRRPPDVVLGIMALLFLCILVVLSIPALQSETLRQRDSLAQLRLKLWDIAGRL